MGKRLGMQNGHIYDDPPPQEPLIVLDCKDCPGYQHFEHLSATVVRCETCEAKQTNENLVDLNMERL